MEARFVAERLVALAFAPSGTRRRVPRIQAAAERLERGLDAWFGGKAEHGIQLELEGTDFQRRVWKAVMAVPRGKTTTYAALARRLRKPQAVRAVGRANGLNPISLLVPCHRIVGSDGSLTGYGGGLDRKRRLLEHEGVRFDDKGRVVEA